MTEAQRERLRGIKRFDQLLAFLRDELDWPIDDIEIDDLTFDYEPEELGIDSKNAAKVDSIQQLRPLTSSQPWGIFFLKFEPKRLPIVALRRILRALVIKRRQSLDQAERASWQMNDLLFVSNYGEGEERHMTFAHFTESEEDMGDLPSLRVLGWDNADTAHHLDHVHSELTEKLHWPEDDTDHESWRKRWSEAFILKPREVITTSKQLAIELADLARDIRKRANAVLAVESDKGPLKKLMTAFKEALIHDLEEDDFADMYAQTIAYGLLSARVSRPAGLVADNLAEMVPLTSPFLKELLETFLNVGGRKEQIDFDELGINDVVELLREANMEAVLRDFGDKNPEEDPVIHFYELFLKEYDAKKRMARGVFYTPKPVVSFIVRSVDELLRTDFGLKYGLADTTTWGEMVAQNKDIKIPEGTAPDTPFVQILDPATGTGTFLVEAIDLIYKTLTEKWKAEGRLELEFPKLWNDYVPKYLLPRLYGYELMMAPYAIAHMKIGLKLHEHGYNFECDERARVYLTNALEPAKTFQMSFDIPALAHEAEAVNTIKRVQRFTVVIGNPPYSKLSGKAGPWISDLLHGKNRSSPADYYSVAGVPMGETTIWLQDDYIRFTRLSHCHIDNSGVGIHGFISNSGYLDNPTLRGMRHNLADSFSKLFLLDLHGNTKRGETGSGGVKDKNVFEIQQGVAIGIFVKGISCNESTILHADLWGQREQKYNVLGKTSTSDLDWNEVNWEEPQYLFIPTDSTYGGEYKSGWKVTDIFPAYHSGIITKRDSLTIHWTPKDVLRTVSDFMKLPPEQARDEYHLPQDVRDWKVEWAQEDLRQAGLSRNKVVPILYRPFDIRFTYFTGKSRGFVGWPVPDYTRTMSEMDNIALVTTRMTKGETFQHILISSHMAEVICLSAKTSNNGFVFPLYPPKIPDDSLLFKDSYSLEEVTLQRANFAPAYLKLVSDQLGLVFTPHDIGTSVESFSPKDLFFYVVSVLHSPAYRDRYKEFLRRDFPRVPLPGGLELFRDFVRLGSELVALHLMESPKLDDHITILVGSSDFQVEKASYSDGTVWLDKAKTYGFNGVPEDVWNFHIGGYQVCQKWLKSRGPKKGKPGRTLTDEDKVHYQKIVVALSETIRIMSEIDKVIETHGGWPDAFATQN